ncbi:MAG: hypothetical protein R2690_17735 [Acidimicrobiales bacterium]
MEATLGQRIGDRSVEPLERHRAREIAHHLVDGPGADALHPCGAVLR